MQKVVGNTTKKKKMKNLLGVSTPGGGAIAGEKDTCILYGRSKGEKPGQEDSFRRKNNNEVKGDGGVGGGVAGIPAPMGGELQKKNKKSNSWGGDAGVGLLAILGGRSNRKQRWKVKKKRGGEKTEESERKWKNGRVKTGRYDTTMWGGGGRNKVSGEKRG